MRNMLLLMMAGLTLATVFIFVILMFVMKMIPKLDHAAYQALVNQVEYRAGRLGREIESINRNVWKFGDNLTDNMNGLLKAEEIAFGAFATDAAYIDTYLNSCIEELMEVCQSSFVSGAFVILDVSYPWDNGGKASLHIRRAASHFSQEVDQMAFSLRHGPTELPDLNHMPLDAGWVYGFSVAEEESGGIYTIPFEAAVAKPYAPFRELGYWSNRFRLAPEDMEIVTYSVPLIGSGGTVYGVCGVEMSIDSIRTYSLDGEIPYTDGFNIFGRVKDGVVLKGTVIANDPPGVQFVQELAGDLRLNNSTAFGGDSQVYTYFNSHGMEMVLAASKINVYMKISPFAEGDYYFMVIAPKSQVLSLSMGILGDAMAMFVVSGLISAAGALFLSRYFAKRIEKLAVAAGTLDPEKPAELPRTGIHELDLVADVIEQMNRDVAYHAARMSTIVDSVDMPMGAYEIRPSRNMVFLTDSLYRLLDVAHSEEDSQYMDAAAFENILPQAYFPKGEGGCLDFYWTSPGKKQLSKWLRLRRTFDADSIYGTVLDITEEVKNKEKLEYEKNYDPLTHLLNRNAYYDVMGAMVAERPDEMGVFIFGDLDNLKPVNDTFGHDVGDRYILTAAEALSLIEEEGGVVARISGDEFAGYLHGGRSRKELKEKVDGILAAIREKSMPMPDGDRQKVRISIGLAYYPDDADNLIDLMKYADYAMYEIKHSSKGGTQEFNRESYNRNSYILSKPSQLDYLLDQSRIRFAFQPIIDVKSGEVLGYEALMRPQTREIHSPAQVISLARSQSKLPQLEQLTLFSILNWIEKNYRELGDLVLFFNSLPSQLLLDSEYDRMKQTIDKYNCKMVMEITEEEQSDPGKLQGKVKTARLLRMKIALDDFGSGYSNFINLLNINPEYVKIDMSIIRNIHRDMSRQTLLKSIVDYAGIHGLETIAEGVETAEELETVISIGVSCVQGFYLCRPEFNLVKELPAHLKHHFPGTG